VKRPSMANIGVLVLLLASSWFGPAGCDRDVSGEVMTLSGAYLGDVVTVVATGYLLDALGIEGSASTDDQIHEDEHSHAAEPLHDHEH